MAGTGAPSVKKVYQFFPDNQKPKELGGFKINLIETKEDENMTIRIL